MFVNKLSINRSYISLLTLATLMGPHDLCAVQHFGDDDKGVLRQGPKHVDLRPTPTQVYRRESAVTPRVQNKEVPQFVEDLLGRCDARNIISEISKQGMTTVMNEDGRFGLMFANVTENFIDNDANYQNFLEQLDEIQRVIPDLQDRLIKIDMKVLDDQTPGIKMKARRYNQELLEFNKRFKIKIKENGSQINIQRLSQFIYGMLKIDDEYFGSVLKMLKDEQNQLNSGLSFDNGFASDYIPNSPQSRENFLPMAVGCVTSIKKITNLIVSNQTDFKFEEFNSFCGFYIKQLSLCCSNLSKSIRCDMEGVGVFSLLELGRAERTFQVLEELKPLAEIAFALGHVSFSSGTITKYVDTLRSTLTQLQRGWEPFYNPESLKPDGDVTQKALPRSKNQKKKDRQRKRIQENIHTEVELRRLEEAKAQKEKVSIPATSPAKRNPSRVQQTETLTDWFNRTEEVDKKRNLKSEYRNPSSLALHQQSKKEKKNAKKGNNVTNDNNKPVPQPKLDEETQPIPSARQVVHAPHKNGSKKLRPEHIKEIRGFLVRAGYDINTIKQKDISGGSWKVFQDIHDNTYSGEMDAVTNMIRALSGYVDESRSGSRISIYLRHFQTNEFMGNFLLAPRNEEKGESPVSNSNFEEG